MTLLKAQFIKRNPSADGGFIPKSGTVIAKLMQVDAPNDTIRVLKSTKAEIDEFGAVQIELSPTADNQAYEIYIAPNGKKHSRIVQIPNQGTIQWEGLIDVNPHTFAPYASSDGGSSSPGDGGLVQYDSIETVNAVHTAEIGILNVENTVEAFPAFEAFVGEGASSLLIQTTIQDHKFDEAMAPGVGAYRVAHQTMHLTSFSGNYLVAHRSAIYIDGSDALAQPYSSWKITTTIGAPEEYDTGEQRVLYWSGFSWNYAEMSVQPFEEFNHFELAQRDGDGSVWIREENENRKATSRQYVDSVAATLVSQMSGFLPIPQSGNWTFKVVDGVAGWVEDV